MEQNSIELKKFIKFWIIELKTLIHSLQILIK